MAKTAQRADRADQVHAGGAQRLHRQEIAEQRAVGHIDRKGPAGDVAAPGRLVTRQHLRRAGILAVPRSPCRRCRRYRRHRAVPCSGPARRSAAAHGRLRRPARCGSSRICAGCSIASGNTMPSGLDLDAAEDGMRLPLGGVATVLRRPAPSAASASVGRADPDHAAAIAGQRHEHAGALRRVKLGRDILVRPANARC